MNQSDLRLKHGRPIGLKENTPQKRNHYKIIVNDAFACLVTHEIMNEDYISRLITKCR